MVTPDMVTPDIIGSSPTFQAVLEQINTVAPQDCTVLLCGETGTGKEVAARAIHNASPRRHGSFVPVNCAAIPAGLLESELFGHERGAFTGAVSQTKGRFHSADRGTLFLDEIGELPLDLQPKLLRVLQEKQFERLGGCQTFQVDARVIAASNLDLWALVQQRRFRADLYYRLAIFPVTLPPLRERVDDIPLLVNYFVKKFAARQGKSIDCIPDEVLQILKLHDWPGNIRELQNLLERAVIMTSGATLHFPYGGLRPPAPNTSTVTLRTLAEAERDHIIQVLGEVGWVVGGLRGAAALLGVPRTTLISRMNKLGIPRRNGASVASAGIDRVLPGNIVRNRSAN